MEQNSDTSVPVAPVVENSKQNGGNGLKIATIIACIVAVCGIGFGVYGMMQSSQKSNQISDGSQAITVNDSTTKRENPVISATAPEYYNISYDSPEYPVGSDVYFVKLTIENGVISNCDLYLHTIKWIDLDMVEENRFNRDCSGVNGIPGKIYKAVTIGEGQDGSTSSVAFIMEDGTVSYSPAEELVRNVVNNGAGTAKGILKINGFVVDAFTVGVREDGIMGGYVTTIFVLSDGTYVKYDPSMLN